MNAPVPGAAAEFSVIVRTMNSMATVAATLDSIRAQDVPAEIVVVDSGSADGTVEFVRSGADVVVEIAPAEFSFGRALNRGAAAASGRLHAALSSHCAFPDAGWLRRAAEHLDAGALAACGGVVDGELRRLTAPLAADAGYLRAHPFWGFTNHASAWRSDAWQQHRFDERLGAAEDKEWSWRVVRELDGPLVVDPALLVPSGHRRDKGVRSYYHRIAREVGAYEEILGLPRYTALDAIRDWASRNPDDPWVIRSSRPFGRTRAVEVWARRSGTQARA